MKGRLEDLRAVNNGEDGGFIGRLLWFSVSDMKVDRSTLEGLFNKAGINHKYLPKEISPRDALRRASKEIEVKREPNGQKGVHMNILVREVTCDKDRLVRQVVRETVDSDNTRLGYDVIAQVTLEGQDNPKLEIKPMCKLYPNEQKLVDSIRDRYDDAVTHYNGKNARDIIKKILFDCNPVSVRPSGGVYFVPEQYAGVVEGLKGLTNALAPYSTTGESTKMYGVPVIDTVEQREMVMDSLEAQVGAMAEGLLKEMAEAEKAGSLTQKRATQFVERVKELKKSCAEYKEWLETEKLKAESNLDIARKKATKLLSKVESPA